MKDNKRGSTLVAAVVIIMLIMVILGAALGIASSYYKNSVNEMNKKQVYLSAKSGAQLIADYISEGNTKLIPTQEGIENAREINKINVEKDKTTMSGSVQKTDENTLKIVVTSEFGEDNYSIQVIMRYENLLWKMHSYCEAKERDALC